MVFPERLKELREQKCLSMAMLASNIGVSDAAICKWENGNSEPKASNIKILADFFEVSADYLVGLESDTGIKKYSAPVKKEMPAPTLSQDEQELLDIYHALAREYKAQILEYARYFATRRGIKIKNN